MSARIEAPDLGFVPSKIDENVEIACPFFVRGEKVFSSVYAKQHAQVTAYLSVKLQERFDSVLVEGEAPLSSDVRGFLDLKFILKNSRILVEGDNRVLCALEVKTGSVKICQPAYYASIEDVPVLLVEAKTGDVFIISPEGGRDYLEIMKGFFDSKSALKAQGVYCPSRDNCRFCANRGCEYLGESYKQKIKPSTLLDDNLKAFARNLPEIVEKVSGFIEELLDEQVRRPETLPEMPKVEGSEK